MLLLLTIVQSEDAPILAEQLLGQGLRLTRIHSTGGFLTAGSVALLLGIEESRYQRILQTIRENCQTRLKYISTASALEPMFILSAPIEVEVGGAVVFGVPVERFFRISGAADASLGEVIEPISEATGAAERSAEPAKGASNLMKLIVAIVRGENIDAVIHALVAAQHRLTRINTTGGFLRRGNATLLIGVEAPQVDEVVALIQTACRPRTEPAPIAQGIPEYAATVFVLDATHFARL
jgi:uncharacterized protein YaaQ